MTTTAAVTAAIAAALLHGGLSPWWLVVLFGAMFLISLIPLYIVVRVASIAWRHGQGERYDD